MSFTYARSEISSFVPGAARPYIRCMKNRYPTVAELYAVEREARRLRSAEVARLLRAGASALKALFSSLTSTKAVRHA